MYADIMWIALGGAVVVLLGGGKLVVIATASSIIARVLFDWYQSRFDDE